MATSSTRHVRLKLYFDNAAVEPSWFLLDTKRLKTIGDVQAEITSQFIDCGSSVKLYMCGCVLPPCEKSLVLNQDDDVHVIINKNMTVCEDIVMHDHGSSKKKKKKKKKEMNDKSEESDVEKIQNQQDRKKKIRTHKDRHSEATVTSELSEPTDAQNEHCSENLQTGKIRERTEKKVLELESRKRDHSLDRIDQNHCDSAKKMKGIEQEVGQEAGGTTETPVSLSGEPEKKKRKRIRNRKKKQDKTLQSSTGNSLSVIDNSGKDSSHMPQIRPVYDKRRGGKFLSGTRNNSPRNQDNKHITFGSDESEKEENYPVCSDNNADTNKTAQDTMATDGQDDNVIGYFADSRSVAMDVSDCRQDRSSADWVSGQLNSVYDCSVPVESGPTPVDMLPVSSTPHYPDSGVTDFSHDLSMVTEPYIEEPTVITSVLKSGATVYRRQRPNRERRFQELSKEKQLQTVATHRSIILQNTMSTDQEDEEADSFASEVKGQDEFQVVAIRKDYSKFTTLQGPPREGDQIAYKILEMSDSYTPEVSDYKEARVISFDPAAQAMQVELDRTETSKRTAGKFDVTFEDEDDLLTNVQVEPETICVPWSSVIDARLVSA